MKKLISVLTLLMMALPLSAQTNSRSVGAINAETMRPSLTKEGIIDVESADLGTNGNFDLGLWFWYANDPLVIAERDDDSVRVNRLVSDRIGTSLTFAYSILDWMQLGVEVPLILWQDGETSNLNSIIPSNQVTNLTGFGLGDIRVLPKFRLLSAEKSGVNLAVQANLVFPSATTQDNYMGGENFWIEPAVLLSRRYDSGFRWAANVGANFRSSYQVANLDIGQNIDARFGVGKNFGETQDWGLDGSIRGSFQFYPDFFDDNVKYENAVEANVGVHKDFDEKWQGFAGAGAGLIAGPGTPDWRLFAGVRYSPRGCADSDKDGLCDADDKCPEDAEDRDEFEDEDGCPDTDNDGDAILDKDDKCPNEKEDVDGFEDEDGCPDVDNDQDGILDVEDKCPVVAGVKERDGCPVVDRDEDGILDTDDKCPDEKGVPARDGCPIPDKDGDGLEDAEDKCPEEAGPRMFGGCPDTDGDGFPDNQDKCPKEAEVINGVKDDDGCPDKGKTLVELKADKIDIRESVYFKTGKSAIQSRSFNLLNQVAAILKAHPEILKVRIEGHTDSRGKDSYNLRLSKSRAAAVMEYLISKGVAADHLVSEGYGETRPIADNKTKTGRQQNRRVDFFVAEQVPQEAKVVK